MAVGVNTDFKIYNEQFHTGVTEVLMQDAAGLNSGAAGTINLTTQRHKGHYTQEAFYQELQNLISIRDIDSVADVADEKLTHEEDVKVKLNRRIGPVAQTLDAFRKIAKDPGEMSYVLGQQWGKAILLDYLNLSVAAAATIFGTTYSFDGTASTINHGQLVSTLSQMGDAGKTIRAFIMHSKTYYDLMGKSIADKVFEVAGVTVNNGTVASLGRPVIVSDIPGLVDIDAGGPGVHHYKTLALTGNSIQVDESEEREIVSDLITGKENLFLRYQGEYAFSLGYKGFAWNIATGGKNPTEAVLNSAANWTKIVSDDKSTGGVVLTTL